MTTFRLSDVAPRLARARDAHNAWVREIDRERLRLVGERLDLERLVAHRELQLIRAGRARTNRRRYLEVRTAKLESARHALRCVNDSLSGLGRDMAA